MNRSNLSWLVLIFLTFGPCSALAQHAHPKAEGDLEDGVRAELSLVRTATARYRDIRVAEADGFVRFGRFEGPLMGEHWFRRDLVDAPFDPARPSTLQYAVLDGERVLVGVAYSVYRSPTDPVPEGFSGTSDRWHVHDLAVLARTITADRPVLRWLAGRAIERGRIGPGGGRTELTMLHAWVWLDNPDGIFADSHRVLPYLRAGLPADYAAAGNEAAAMGISLLAGNGCSEEMRRLTTFVRPGRQAVKRLSLACDEARAAIERARSLPAAELNRVAADAWFTYLEARDAGLSAEQRSRLASIRGDHLEVHPN